MRRVPELQSRNFSATFACVSPTTSALLCWGLWWEEVWDKSGESGNEAIRSKEYGVDCTERASSSGARVQKSHSHHSLGNEENAEDCAYEHAIPPCKKWCVERAMSRWRRHPVCAVGPRPSEGKPIFAMTRRCREILVVGGFRKICLKPRKVQAAGFRDGVILHACEREALLRRLTLYCQFWATDECGSGEVILKSDIVCECCQMRRWFLVRVIKLAWAWAWAWAWLAVL